MRPLVALPSFTRASPGSNGTGGGGALHARAYHLVRFPDPHAQLAASEVPPPVRGPGAFALPLHMRRELVPPVALSEAEKKAGLDVRGKRPHESMAEYTARRQRTPKHRDEFRWVLESDAGGDTRYEGKEITEHSGQYLAVFPAETPGGPLPVARLDLWLDMRRFVDLSEAKARVSDQARVKQLRLSRQRNMRSAMGKLTGDGAAAGNDKNSTAHDGYYDDPELQVDHVYDLAIDRAGLDKDAMADNDYEPDDDDQGAGEVEVNNEGLADVLPGGEGEVLDTDVEDGDDESRDGGGGDARGEGMAFGSSEEDEDEEANSGSAAAAAAPRPTMLATVSADALAAAAAQPQRQRMDALTETVVRVIRTSGGRIKVPELLRRVKAESRPGVDLRRVQDILLRVGRAIRNEVDGDMVALRDEFQ